MRWRLGVPLLIALLAVAVLWQRWSPTPVEATATQVVSPSQHADTYLGAAACQQCHAEQYQQWQQSHHAKAMQLPTEASVLGDFNNVQLNFHGIASRLYRDDGRYVIETPIDKRAPRQFELRYTFGHYPLQQYLVALDKGHLQALNIAWDSRPASEGGQRWLHLQADEALTPEHPFFWTQHFQNWNSRCADCHSTNLNKAYQPDTHAYNTQFSELNVACEACHGPAGEHVARVRAGTYSAAATGFAKRLATTSQFRFNGRDAIARNEGQNSAEQLNACAGCHSRRSIIATLDVREDYHDQYQLSTLDAGLYFADGQIDDEVFVYGSFLQSKMHQAGVSCGNCHNPHSGQLVASGNGVCLQCHQPTTYEATSHSQHRGEGAATACVSCHMPERTYMQVDARRDHSFSVPRPALATAVGAPNACGNCHRDWSSEQLIEAYQTLYGDEPESAWAEANAQARRRNFGALNRIAALTRDTTLPAIQRASLLVQLAAMPAQASFEAVQANLSDADPVVRAAAVSGSAFIAPARRLAVLAPVLHDNSKVVRMAAAQQLVGAATNSSTRALLAPLMAEYERSLLLTEDTPATQLNLANLYYAQGDIERAEQAYQRALQIAPAFTPALVNLADLYRARGDDRAAAEYLQTALSYAPDSAAVQYSLGLLYVRQQRLDQALPHLQQAQQVPTAVPRYAYVYAVALDSVQRRDEAIQVLLAADKRWPQQADIQQLLAEYQAQ